MNSGDADRTDRLERALRASLRPVDPGAAFTAALQARLEQADSHPLTAHAAAQAAPHRPASFGAVPHPRLHSASLALAASLVVALSVGWQLLDVRAAQHAAQVRLEQLRIHEQVLLALEITSERLGIAQQRIEQYQSQEKNL